MVSLKIAKVTAAAYFPPGRLTINKLAEAAATCQACELYKKGTQTVFGEGPSRADIIFVGEQPGDYEDRAGHPFVGPAGKLLDRALVEAGIDRSRAYVTNAVKHFNWEPRGKKRLHAKPKVMHLDACRPWLEAEIEVIKPKVVVCLGATAAQSMLGRQFRITRQRGQIVTNSSWAPAVMATVHPSAILRAPDDDTRHRAYDEFVADLKKLHKVL
jgi:DNA polymerase